MIKRGSIRIIVILALAFALLLPFAFCENVSGNSSYDATMNQTESFDLLDNQSLPNISDVSGSIVLNESIIQNESVLPNETAYENESINVSKDNSTEIFDENSWELTTVYDCEYCIDNFIPANTRVNFTFIFNLMQHEEIFIFEIPNDWKIINDGSFNFSSENNYSVMEWNASNGTKTIQLFSPNASSGYIFNMRIMDSSFSSFIETYFLNASKINDSISNESISNISSFDMAAMVLMAENTSNSGSLRLFREQSSGAGPGKNMIIGFSVLNNGSASVSGDIIEHYPPGWKIIGLPQNAVDNGTDAVFSVENLTANELQYFNYTIRASNISGNYSFNTFLNYLNESSEDIHAVEVASDRAFFETQVDLFRYTNKVERAVSNGTDYKAGLIVKNIGVFNVTSKRTFYYWQYDDSIWEVKKIESKNCNENPVSYRGKKAIKCEWLDFNSGEKRVIKFDIKSISGNAYGYSHSESVYDPLKKDNLFVRVLNSLKRFFSTIGGFFRSFFTGGITGNAVKDAKSGTDNTPTGNAVGAPSDNSAGNKNNAGKNVNTTDKESDNKTTVKNETAKPVLTVAPKNETQPQISSNVTPETSINTTNAIPQAIPSGGGGGRGGGNNNPPERKPKEPETDASVYPFTISPGENATYNVTVTNIDDKVIENAVISNLKISEGSIDYYCILPYQFGNNSCSLGNIMAGTSAEAIFVIFTNNDTSIGQHDISSDISYSAEGKEYSQKRIGEAIVEIGNSFVTGFEDIFIMVSATEIKPQSEYAPVKIKDSSNREMKAVYKVRRGATFQEVESIEEVSNCTDCQMQMEFRDSPVKSISFKGLDIENSSLDLRIDNVPADRVSSGNEIVLQSYAIDASKMEFTEGKLISTAKGKRLWKCAEWDFELAQCNGTWVKLFDIVPGQDYNITISANDPGFKETGISSINTNKSVYHPFESAGIIMVVLDRDGKLVDGAEVNLTIGTPSSGSYFFSTLEGSIIQTERGIYYARFDDTEEAGNYSMFVSAESDNVDSEMSSYFTVSDYYEFDIIRNTDVTYDPWKAPFDSSIRIISYDYSNEFDYTEVLPGNFTVNETDADVVTYSDKVTLKWENLENNSVVYYKAFSPLITPDLYEIGPSYIDYGAERYTEERPWYLAVDPPGLNYLLLFYSSTSDNAPNSDWECVSCSSGNVMYQRLIKGAATFGTQAGAANHQHTLTWVSSSNAAGTVSTYKTAGADVSLPSSTHTHGTINSYTVPAVDNFPSYRDLKVIRYKTGIPKTLPSGVIAIFNTSSLPSGFDAYTDENGYFIRAGSSIAAGSTANTHVHSTSITTGGPTGTTSYKSGSTSSPTAAHTHTATQNSNSGDIRPKYREVKLGKTNTAVSIPEGNSGFIGLINGSAPLGWTSISGSGKPFYGRFIVGSGTYGATGGALNHNHADTGISVQNPTLGNVRSTASTAGTSTTHSHTITVRYANATNNPYSVTSVFAYAKDTQGPTIALESPADNGWSGPSVSFQYKPSDYSTIRNCSLILNGAFDSFNTSEVVKDSTNTISKTLADGTYTWTINCTDQYRHVGTNSTGRTVYVDVEGPVVSLTASNPDYGYKNYSNVFVSFSVTDDVTVDNCKLYIDGTLNRTINSPTKGTTLNFTALGVTDDFHHWNITCTDQYSNTGNSATRHMWVDTATPTVSLSSPGNNAFFNYTSPHSFTYTGSDLHLDSCMMWANFTTWSKIYTDNSPNNGTSDSFGPRTVDEGKYRWNVYCNDSAQNSGSAASDFKFTVDATDPAAAIKFPPGDYNTSAASVEVDITHTEIHPDRIDLRFDGGHQRQAYSGGYSNITKSGLTQGAHTYYVWLNDSAKNRYSTATRTLTVDWTAPELHLTNPETNTWTNEAPKTFYFTAEDNIIEVRECRLFINGNNNESSYFHNKSISGSIGGSLSSGSHTWKINCSDLIGNTNVTAERTINVDLAAPVAWDEQFNESSLYKLDYMCLTVNITDAHSYVNLTKAEIHRPLSGHYNYTLSNETGICGDSGDDIFAAKIQLSEVGTYEWVTTHATDRLGNEVAHDVTGVSVIVLSLDIMNLSLTSPMTAIEINETGEHNSFELNCTLNCTVGECNSTIIYPRQYYSGSWNYITDSSSNLRSSVNSINCGDMIEGNYCFASYTITAASVSGETSIPVRCRAISTTAGPKSTLNTTISINDAPAPYFSYPAASAWLHGTEVLNGSTSNDSDGSIERYLFYIDNNILFTSPDLLCNTTEPSCSLNTVTQSQCAEHSTSCYLKLLAIDDNSLENSTYIQVGIDNTAPEVSVTSPLTYANITSTSYAVTASAADAGSEVANVQFFYKNHSETSWNPICTDSSAPYSCNWNTTLRSNMRFYEINATATDNEGNTDSAVSTNLTLDFYGPTMVLNLPSDNAYAHNHANFSYTATDSVFGVKNCSLIFDGAVNQTNTTILGDMNYFRLPDIAQGDYLWKVRCYDKQSNVNDSVQRTVKIDRTGPVSALSSPLGQANISASASVNATATDAKVGTDTVGFYYRNGGAGALTLICKDSSNPYGCSWSTSALSEGNNYRVSAIANDTFNNIGSYSTNNNITIDHTAPKLLLDFPQDDWQDIDGYINFTFNVTDSLLHIKNCSLLLDGAINQTKTNIVSGSNYISADLGNSDYNWQIDCYDMAKNRNLSVSRNLSIRPDDSNPIVYSITPDANKKMAYGNVTFYFNVTDRYSGISSCKLVLNGTGYETTASPEKNITTGILHEFSNGDYLWSINCTDSAGNIGTSASRKVTIKIEYVINATVTTDQFEYWPGDFQNISINTADLYANPLNTNLRMDILKGNSSAPWWDTTWKKRKAVYISESSGVNRSNNIVYLNVTGLGGSVTNCANQLRIISNVTKMFKKSAFNVIATDNSNYCYVKFIGNISASIAGQNNYYAYYNKSTASSPGYGTIIEDHYHMNFSSGGGTDKWAYQKNNEAAQPPGSGPDVTGQSVFSTYTSVADSDTSRYSTAAAARYNYAVHNFKFTLPSTGVTLRNFTISWQGYGSGDVANVYIRNFNTNAWDYVGQRPANSEGTVTATYSSTASNYFDSSGYVYFLAETYRPLGSGATLYSNFAGITAYYMHAHATIGGMERHVTQQSGEAGIDGFKVMNWTVDEVYGTYSAVSLAEKTLFTNSSGHAVFKIKTDTTAPKMTPHAPANSNYTQTGTKFIWIPKDNSGHIRNCSLYLNTALNFTNTTILNNAENKKISTPMEEMAYAWYVRCYDYANNTNVTSTWNVYIDNTAPTIIYRNPAASFNTTGASALLNYSYWDNYNNPGSCTIKLNNADVNTQSVNNHSSASYTASVNVGYNYWNVSCRDTAGNTGTNTTRQIVRITEPKNIKIYTTATKDDAILSWDAVAGATKYNIYSTDNYVSGFPGAPTKTVIVTNATDLSVNGIPERYYKIEAQRGSTKYASSRYFGKYERTLSSGWELVSSPLNLSYNTLGAFATYNNPFPVYQDNNIIAVYRYNATSDLFEKADYDSSGWQQVSGSEGFTNIEPNTGYWLETNASGTLLFLGELMLANKSVSLADDWNLKGWTSIQHAHLANATEPPSYPIIASPANSVVRMYKYDNGSFEMTNHFAGYGWYPAYNTPDFITINPTYGYYMKSSGASTWTVASWR